MGNISKQTLQKLVLLTLIALYKDGVYSNYRFQKVLYFALKRLEISPFKYDYTEHGQYSYDVGQTLRDLIEVGVIEEHEIQSDKDGSVWRLCDNLDKGEITSFLHSIDPGLQASIRDCVKEIGYLKTNELTELANSDELLNKSTRGDVLLIENLPEKIHVNLSSELCDDLEMSLNSKFSSAMRKLINGMNEVEFDLGEVKEIEWSI